MGKALQSFTHSSNWRSLFPPSGSEKNARKAGRLWGLGVSRRTAPVDSSFVPLNLKSLQIPAAEPPRLSFVELHCPLFEPSRCPCDQVVRLRRPVSKQKTMNTETSRPVRSHHWSIQPQGPGPPCLPIFKCPLLFDDSRH